MNYFLKANKNLLIYSLIFFITIPIFGINFFISFLGNILLILFLIPILLLLLLLLIFIGFNSYKSKINTCSKDDQLNKKPSERTIEVKAEEIK